MERATFVDGTPTVFDPFYATLPEGTIIKIPETSGGGGPVTPVQTLHLYHFNGNLNDSAGSGEGFDALTYGHDLNFTTGKFGYGLYGVSGGYVLSAGAMPAYSGDFTVEFWVRNPGGGSPFISVLFDDDGEGNNTTFEWSSDPSSGTCTFRVGDANAQAGVSITLPSGQFTHVAVTYDQAADTAKLWVGGSLVLSYVTGQGPVDLFNGTTTDIRLSVATASTTVLDELRISQGLAYTANFTPSAAEFVGGFEVVGTNTLLLNHFNGVDEKTVIMDEVENRVWTNGTYSIEATGALFGGGRMELTNNGVVGGNFTNPAAGDWTWEVFVEMPSGGVVYVHFHDSVAPADRGTWYLQNDGGGVIIASTGTDMDSESPAFSEFSGMKHFAVVRHGDNYYMYHDGNRIMNITDATDMGSFNQLYLYLVGGANAYFEECRMSNVARYTGATYTVPAVSLAVD